MVSHGLAGKALSIMGVAAMASLVVSCSGGNGRGVMSSPHSSSVVASTAGPLAVPAAPVCGKPGSGEFARVFTGTTQVLRATITDKSVSPTGMKGQDQSLSLNDVIPLLGAPSALEKVWYSVDINDRLTPGDYIFFIGGDPGREVVVMGKLGVFPISADGTLVHQYCYPSEFILDPPKLTADSYTVSDFVKDVGASMNLPVVR